jgi:4-amino-4-deoxy-L-arabinose transferase-like glycosyltransferase
MTAFIKKHWEITLLLLILAIAAFFRFYLIKEMPGGLFPDEAANGLDINNIFKGHFQPFFARGNGREALFFYLLAISVKIFGRGPWQHHIVSASIGLLSVFTTYLLTKRLFDSKSALLASFLMAISTWHIVLSRTAFRAIMIPLFTTLTFYFIVRFFQAKNEKEKIWTAILSGIFFAGGFYTYIAYRIMLVILGLAFIFLLAADRKQNFKWFKQFQKYFWTALAAAFITFLPIGIYFAQHPGSFVGRSSQVSVFNPDLNHGHLLKTVAEVTFKQLRAYFAYGDINWRQNISGDPFLSPFVSIFFGLALIALTALVIKFLWQCLKNKQEMQHLKYLVPVFLFWGMLIPVISTAEGIPHGLRAVGTIPAVFMITAIGLIYFAKMVLKLWHYKWMEYLYAFVAVAVFAAMTYLAYTQYFVYTYNNPDNFSAFRSDLSTVSNYINQHPGNKLHTFLVLDLFSVQTVDYLTSQSNNPYTVVDPANAYKLHIQKGDIIIFTQSTLFDNYNFDKTHADKNLKQLEIAYDRIGSFQMAVLQYTANDKSISLAANADASFIAINFGDRVDWSWDNLSFDPWQIKIWQCSDAKCQNSTLIKVNNQNDYFANNDHISIDGTKSDLYYKAAGYDLKGNLIKNFGIIKLQKYK